MKFYTLWRRKHFDKQMDFNVSFLSSCYRKMIWNIIENILSLKKIHCSSCKTQEIESAAVLNWLYCYCNLRPYSKIQSVSNCPTCLDLAELFNKNNYISPFLFYSLLSIIKLCDLSCQSNPLKMAVWKALGQYRTFKSKLQ